MVWYNLPSYILKFRTGFLTLKCNTAVPLVHSVSYGDVESSISLAYVNRVDQVSNFNKVLQLYYLLIRQTFPLNSYP